MSFLSSVFDGIFGLANSAIGYASSSRASRKQYKYNLALQKQAQKWQALMSNTAHQREVKDLRLAGLNPVLSSTGGASTGSVGATSVGLNTYVPDFLGDVFSAIDLRTANSEAEAAEANASSAKAIADINKTKSFNAWDLGHEEVKNAQYQGDLLRSQKAYYDAQTKAQNFMNSALKADSDFYKSGYGRFIRFTDRTLQPAKGIFGGSVNKNYNVK